MPPYEEATDTSRVLPQGGTVQEFEEGGGRSQKSGEGRRRAQAQSRRPPLTQERLKELLSYDPETGVFVRRKQAGASRAGSIAGAPNTSGYIYISVDSTSYRAHRLAWFYVYGVWPNSDLDHINRVRSDNRLDNLRAASRAQNLLNVPNKYPNSLGVKGVRWFTRTRRWQARVKHNGIQYNLGYFRNFGEAVARVRAKREELHGEFANHG